MDYLDQARRSVTKVIGDLRKSGSEAFAAGSIDDAVRIGSWIKVLQGLVSMEGQPASSAAVPGQTMVPAAPGSLPVKSGRLSRAGKHDYPRFLRRSNDLVKVGWSKTGKAEYEHKAPREAVEATAAAIAATGAAGAQFTANDVFAQSAVGGLPQYQVYLAMAWFRSAGLLEQIGKQGYRCLAPEQLEKSVQIGWQELAE